MNLVVTIAGVNRTDWIDWRSFRKTDILTSQVDTLEFKTKKYGGRTWRPSINDEVIVTNGATRIFGGVIVEVEAKLEAKEVIYRVTCKDWSALMDGKTVVETYNNKTVAEIIEHIKNNYLPAGFTTTNVNCNLVIEKISFNYEYPTKCLQELAELTNFSWYVDYWKDIHFFPKGTETAPFDITDDCPYVIRETLKVNQNFSQLRNVVYVRGGEYETAARTEYFDADGIQVTFPLAYKYGSKPTVKVNGVEKTVGVDNLNDFTEYEVLWNYNERYIRFETAPALGSDIEVSGSPLFPVLVKVEEPTSVSLYGEREFKIIDKTIKNKTTARKRGEAELGAYAFGVWTGDFETYEDGLRSGQQIKINSNLLGINENFLIERVTLKMQTPTSGRYSVSVVSTRKFGIIDFLQKLLMDENKKIEVGENEFLEIAKNIIETIDILEEVTLHEDKVVDESLELGELIRRDPWGEGVIYWVFGFYFPIDDNDPKRQFAFDRASWFV